MNQFKIAVFGYNNYSLDVIRHLKRRGEGFVIADCSAANLDRARADGYETYAVDLTNDQTLLGVGIGKQLKIIFCLLDEDSANVFLAISARALDDTLYIISICHNEDANRKLLAAGANKVIDPYQISARKIYEIIRKPEIVELLDNVVFGQQDLNLVEVSIQPGCRLDKTNLNDFSLDGEFNLILLGVEDVEMGNDIHFTTSGINHKLDAGDKLIVLGPELEISKFRKKYAEDV